MRDDNAAMRFNSVAEWLSWQEKLHPEEIELGLQRVNQVYQKLQLRFAPSCRVITVAGSNGKGSCVAYLSAFFRALGHRVATYSSPHLLRYNERIQVNGVAIADADLLRAFARVEQARADISLTYFEFGTLAALAHFAQAQCDLLVLEVGLGGRLDAVNIIDPDIAVITSIGMDHMDWLGDTREQIALEKAGILRANRPFVCSEAEPPANLLEYASTIGADSYLLGRDFHIDEQGRHWQWRSADFCLSDLPLPAMYGRFQLRNMAAALMCVSLLEPEAMQNWRPLPEIIQNVQLPGRIQRLGEKPLRLLDVSHNEQAVAELADVLRQLKQSDATRIFAVFSMLGRKDVKAVIAAIASVVDNWMLAPIQGQASQPLDYVQSLIDEQNAGLQRALACRQFVSLGLAWKQALAEASDNDIVLGFGSFYTVAEILNG